MNVYLVIFTWNTKIFSNHKLYGIDLFGYTYCREFIPAYDTRVCIDWYSILYMLIVCYMLLCEWLVRLFVYNDDLLCHQIDGCVQSSTTKMKRELHLISSTFAKRFSPSYRYSGHWPSNKIFIEKSHFWLANSINQKTYTFLSHRLFGEVKGAFCRQTHRKRMK